MIHHDLPARLFPVMCLLSACLLVLSLWACRAGKAPPPFLEPLAPDLSLEKEISGGELHAYPARLNRGEALVLVVDQQGLDVAVEIFGPRGQSVLFVDGPNGPNGQEPAAIIAERGGEHWLEIRAPETGAGDYRLKVEILGPAGQDVEEYSEALRLYAAAERMRRGYDGESLRSALDLYRDALEHLQAIGVQAKNEPSIDSEQVELWTHRTIGRKGKMLKALERFGEAIEEYEQAISGHRALGSRAELTPLLNEAGGIYQNLAEPQRAQELYEEALRISRELGNPRGEASALNNLGMLHELLGETQDALDLYAEALLLWEEIGREDFAAITLHNLGVTHLTLGRVDEALDFLERALELLQKHENRRDMAVTLTAIGWVRQAGGEAQSALDAYSEAIEKARALDQRSNQAVALNLQGDVYLEQGVLEAAQDSYEQALDLLKTSDEVIHEAHVLTQLGHVAELQEQFVEARSLHERARELFQRSGNLNGQATALIGLARVDRLEGDLQGALVHAEEALSLVESLRLKLQSLAFRSTYFASRFDDYGFYLDLLMDLDRPRDAFEASERARARSLSESLVEARADIVDHADPELLREERALRLEINAKEHLRMRLATGSEAAEDAVEKLDDQLSALLLDYEKLRGEIRASGLRRVGAVEPEAPSLDEVRERLLDQDTHLLAYSLGATRSFLWWVSRDAFQAFELPPRDEVETLARRLHANLSSPPENDADVEDGQSAVDREALSRLLLTPVEHLLDSKRLVVLADGALHSVPFIALSRPSTPDRFLVEDYEIVEPASTTVLALLRDGEEKTTKPPTIAVLADPVFQDQDTRLLGDAQPTEIQEADSDLARSIRDFETDRLDRLPHSRLEGDAILGFLPPERSLKAFDFDASRELVTGGALRSFSILHFATHGLLNDRHPTLSGIVLSQFDEEGNPRNGFLRVHEIPTLELDADLVVLSACRTALGREVRGEGLVGLAQGFFVTGASQVVVSSWSVNDQATAELMRRFYEGLIVRGLSAPRALREAQQSMLQEPKWEAPYFWSAFVLQGDWR